MDTSAAGYPMYIDGKFVQAASGKSFESFNPYTGEVWTRVAQGDAEDADRAVRAAHRALTTGPWPQLTASQRGALLRKLGDLVARDARKLDAHAAHLAEIYGNIAELRRKDTVIQVYGPRALLDAVFAQGRKGISMQRYKGLGEMNPEQLWQTTLDPNARSLMQVRIREVIDADDTFTKLMGDEVEPRREFIQANALTATLDA